MTKKGSITAAAYNSIEMRAQKETARMATFSIKNKSCNLLHPHNMIDNNLHSYPTKYRTQRDPMQGQNPLVVVVM